MGVWNENNPLLLEHKIYIVKEKNKLYAKCVFPKSGLSNSATLINELNESKFKGLVRYDYENDFGEFYLLEKNGNLSLYDELGKVSEAKKVK